MHDILNGTPCAWSIKTEDKQEHVTWEPTDLSLSQDVIYVRVSQYITFIVYFYTLVKSFL